MVRSVEFGRAQVKYACVESTATPPLSNWPEAMILSTRFCIRCTSPVCVASEVNTQYSAPTSSSAIRPM